MRSRSTVAGVLVAALLVACGGADKSDDAKRPGTGGASKGETVSPSRRNADRYLEKGKPGQPESREGGESGRSDRSSRKQPLAEVNPSNERAADEVARRLRNGAGKPLSERELERITERAQRFAQPPPGQSSAEVIRELERANASAP